jgi:hypothetical protein
MLVMCDWLLAVLWAGLLAILGCLLAKVKHQLVEVLLFLLDQVQCPHLVLYVSQLLTLPVLEGLVS